MGLWACGDFWQKEQEIGRRSSGLTAEKIFGIEKPEDMQQNLIGKVKQEHEDNFWGEKTRHYAAHELSCTARQPL